jgi:hypothetical protein
LHIAIVIHDAKPVVKNRTTVVVGRLAPIVLDQRQVMLGYGSKKTNITSQIAGRHGLRMNGAEWR